MARSGGLWYNIVESFLAAFRDVPIHPIFKDLVNLATYSSTGPAAPVVVTTVTASKMTTTNVFSVPIFFIVFRETVEAGIIISVLLSFVEQLMLTGKISTSADAAEEESRPSEDNAETSSLLEPENDVNGNGTTTAAARPIAIAGERSPEENLRLKKLVRRMRIQVWAGAGAGFLIALAIGAAFIAVFYTKLTDVWAQAEQLWEGVFSIIAAILIFIMGIAFLKMDRSRVKWRYKLAKAFDKVSSKKDLTEGQVASAQSSIHKGEEAEAEREGRRGKWALFLLPFVTVLREGLEAVVFVGGVSLNQAASSIPLAVVIGLISGTIVGYVIYRTGSSSTLHWFLIGSTTLLFLIGAGLASKGVGFFQYYVFAQGVGSDVSESGDGPGSFQVKGNVWHLEYGNPETGSPTTNGGWQIFNSILGWNNTATLGTILIYIFYWIAIMGALVYLKWSEGRVSFFGKWSPAGQRRLERRQAKLDQKHSDDNELHAARHVLGLHGEEEGEEGDVKAVVGKDGNALEGGSKASGSGSGSGSGSPELERVASLRA